MERGAFVRVVFDYSKSRKVDFWISQHDVVAHLFHWYVSEAFRNNNFLVNVNFEDEVYGFVAIRLACISKSGIHNVFLPLIKLSVIWTIWMTRCRNNNKINNNTKTKSKNWSKRREKNVRWIYYHNMFYLYMTKLNDFFW